MKPIKFNLIVDGYPVRTLEELREHFNIDDMLQHFYNGTLLRWLSVRNFKNEFDKVSLIMSSYTNKDIDTILIITEKLVMIFLGNQQSDNELHILDNDKSDFFKRTVFHIIAEDERHNRLLKIEQLKLNNEEIINEYLERYELLKTNLLNERKNLMVLNETVNELSGEFFRLFQLEAKELLHNYLKNNMLAVISILLNKRMREFPLKFKEIKSKLGEMLLVRDEYLKDIYNDFKSFKGLDNDLADKVKTFQGDTGQKWIKIENRDILVLQSNAGTKLRDNYDEELEISHVYAKGLVMRGLQFQSFKENHFVKYLPLDEIDGFIGVISTFRGATGGYWKDLKSANGDYLIIKLGSGCFIRSIGKVGEELSADEVNGEFPLLNGIDYKSNSDTEPLYFVSPIN